MSNDGQNPYLDPDYREPKDRLKEMLAREIGIKPFSELSGVAFHHEGATLAGHVLLDTLEEAGYSIDDFDAVGALTAAAVPFVSAMIQAAGSRGQTLDGFVLDFVFPGIKGPAISGKRVILLDAWLSEKSYIQTSSLVTLRHGNELSLDFGVVKKLGAQVVALASLVGGISSPAQSTERSAGEQNRATITVINPVDDSHTQLPFVYAFDQQDVTGGRNAAATEKSAADTSAAAASEDAHD